MRELICLFIYSDAFEGYYTCLSVNLFSREDRSLIQVAPRFERISYLAKLFEMSPLNSLKFCSLNFRFNFRFIDLDLRQHPYRSFAFVHARPFGLVRRER